MSGPAREQAPGRAGPGQARIAAVAGGALVAQRAGGVTAGGVTLAAQRAGRGKVGSPRRKALTKDAWETVRG